MISLLLIWVVLIGMLLAILALTRQIGLLHERLAPLGALTLQNGLDTGDIAPRMTATNLNGRPLAVGGTRSPGERQLLLFVSPSCPICKTLLPTARMFAHAESLDLVLLGDGDVEEYRQLALSFSVSADSIAVAADVGRAYQVGKLPHAVLIDDSGLIVSQGLVNTREHLESLVIAHESGLKSVQDYLAQRKSSHHA